MLARPISDQVFVVINNQWRGRGGRHIRTNTKVYIYKYKSIHLQIQKYTFTNTIIRITLRVEGGMENIFIRQNAFSKRKYNSKQIEDGIAKNTLKEAVRTFTLQQ